MAVSLAAVAPNPVVPGGQVSFEVLVANSGPQLSAANVQLQVDLPVELSLDSINSESGTCIANGCTWATLSDVDSVIVMATANQPADVVARFVVTGENDPLADNNEAEALVSIDADAPPPDAGTVDTSTPEAGSTDSGGGPDAGLGVDGGQTTDEESGCGCRSSEPRATVFWWLVAWGLWRRGRGARNRDAPDQR